MEAKSVDGVGEVGGISIDTTLPRWLDYEISAAGRHCPLSVLKSSSRLAAARSALRVTYFFASRTSSSITVWNVKKYVAPERQTASLQRQQPWMGRELAACSQMQPSERSTSEEWYAEASQHSHLFLSRLCVRHQFQQCERHVAELKCVKSFVSKRTNETCEIFVGYYLAHIECGQKKFTSRFMHQ